MAELEQQLLQAVNEAGSIEDSGEFAEKLQVDHNAVVGVIKSLQAAEMIVTQVPLRQRQRLLLRTLEHCQQMYLSAPVVMGEAGCPR
jgi:DNA-binding MarR family transcriptional regulator